MNRRNWIKKSSLAAAAMLTAPEVAQKGIGAGDPVLKIAHITDVHIRPENGVPDRFNNALDNLLTHDIDFILNGGDTIHAADYDDITRDRVLEQWKAWDDCAAKFGDTPVYSCLGNHDMWWAAADEQDGMYGKDYAAERLKMPGRYYSFVKNGWVFFILDGNNPGVTLDEEQMAWFSEKLENLPENSPVLVMSHHPILTVTGSFYPNDQFSNTGELVQLFYKHKDKIKCCISGHMHLLDQAVYNGTTYYCNGAVSGFWWGDGNERSAGKGYYHETPPGFALLSLYKNGHIERKYIAYNF